MNQTDTDSQSIRAEAGSPAGALPEFPAVKTIRRGWLTAGFVAWLVGLVGSLALMAASFFYAENVLAEFGVVFNGDRVEMTFSDGSSVNLGKLLNSRLMPFNNSQLSEISEKLDAYGQSGAWILPLSVFLGMGFLTWAMCMPFYIQGCMLIYKGWKSLQPLRVLDVRSAQGMPGPVLSLVLLLVPYVNLVWCYFCVPRYARYGRSLATSLGRSYRGPGFGIGLFLCLFFTVQMVVIFILSAVYPFIMSGVDFMIWCTVISTLMNLVLVSVAFVFVRRLSLMVADFGNLSHKSE